MVTILYLVNWYFLASFEDSLSLLQFVFCIPIDHSPTEKIIRAEVGTIDNARNRHAEIGNILGFSHAE